LGLEPTIHHTRGEHAKHYTTDAVECELSFHSRIKDLSVR
jgi:hypothetical protein